MLEEDGDWSKDQFWGVIGFLKQNSRFEEIPEVFDAWTSLDKSRASELNYKRIIGLLCEMGLVEEAVLALEEMKSHGFEVALEVYNSIIHGYANKGQFEDSLLYLNGMQDSGLKPDDDTYDGLIEAYGKSSKYDEMVKCFEMMKNSGCSPDHVTYNLLIREFSKGGLLSKMEKTYQALISKNMGLQTSTLTAMIEAYVNFSMVEKMEVLYHKGIKWKSLMKEDLIRKIAKVYMENYMFSRLDELGENILLRKGRNRLYWCLKLLYHACLLSKKGMNSVLEEMEEANVPWDATVGNILLLAYLKMKDLKVFKIIHSQFPSRYVVPDVVTLGILFDANGNGFDRFRALESWKVHGFLDRVVEMNTDPLVLVAFGKGRFLTMVEETYSSLEPQARKEKRWTYQNLIDFVLRAEEQVET